MRIFSGLHLFVLDFLLQNVQVKVAQSIGTQATALERGILGDVGVGLQQLGDVAEDLRIYAIGMERLKEQERLEVGIGSQASIHATAVERVIGRRESEGSQLDDGPAIMLSRRLERGMRRGGRKGDATPRRLMERGRLGWRWSTTFWCFGVSQGRNLEDGRKAKGEVVPPNQGRATRSVFACRQLGPIGR